MKQHLTPILLIALTGLGIYSLSFFNLPTAPLPDELRPQLAGQVIGKQTQIEVPEDIPIFEPSEIVTFNQTSRGYQITLKTQTALPKVLSFYLNQIDQRDFRQVTTSTTEETQGMRFVKNGTQLDVSLTWDKTTQETVVTLEYTT